MWIYLLVFFIQQYSFIDSNLARPAATWWAQYLPCVRDVGAFEVYKFRNEKLEMIHTIQKKHCVDKHSVDNFIDILQKKILLLEPTHHFYKYVTIKIDYDPHGIIKETIKEARIKISPFGLFPFKTEMTIHQDGYIIVNGEIVYIHDNLQLLTLDDKILIDHGRIKISFPQFRVLEIDLTNPQGDLYQYGVHSIHSQEYHDGVPIIVDKQHYIDYWGNKERYQAFYLKITFNNVIGGEGVLRNLTDIELLIILQNKEKFKQLFVKNTFLYYENYDFTEGEYENVGNGYFRSTTGFIHTFKVPTGQSYMVAVDGDNRELMRVTDQHLLAPVNNKFRIYTLTDNLQIEREVC